MVTNNEFEEWTIIQYWSEEKKKKKKEKRSSWLMARGRRPPGDRKLGNEINQRMFILEMLDSWDHVNFSARREIGEEIGGGGGGIQMMTLEFRLSAIISFGMSSLLMMMILVQFIHWTYFETVFKQDFVTFLMKYCTHYMYR